MAEYKKVSAYQKVQDNRKALVDEVIKSMESGAFWQAGWNVSALRGQNPVSGAKYTGMNRLSLGYAVARNNYQDPRFVTFKQADENGWRVKRGEHGYLCEYWIWTKKEEITNEKGEKETVDVLLEKPRVSYFTVFNMEQLDGNYPKFELPKLSYDDMMVMADDFIASSRCPVNESAQDRAFYALGTDKITLPLRDSFKSSEDFLETLLHEMAHSTGKELGRPMNGNMLSEEYAREELVAELSVLFMKADLGLENKGQHFENHSAYLKSWNKMLKKDYNELYRVSKEADKVAEFLMDKYREYVFIKENTKEEKAPEHEISKDEKIPEKEMSNNTKDKILEKLEITFNYAEGDIGIPEGTVLKGNEAYQFLDKIIKLDNENDRKNEMQKMNISLKYGDILEYENFRINVGQSPMLLCENVSEGLESLLRSPVENQLSNPEFYAEKSKVFFKKEMTPEEIMSMAEKELKNIDIMLSDIRDKENSITENIKAEALRKIDESKDINQYNENGKKHGSWIEIGESAILECKYNNGVKSGKFTETYLTASENEPAKSQGMFRNDKLSGEIVSSFADNKTASIKNFKAGVIIEAQNYYTDGNLKNISVYDKNKCVESKSFYPNGTLKESLEITDKQRLHKKYTNEGVCFKTDITYLSKEALMEAVKQNGESLKFASPEFKNDREVILTAVQNKGSAIDFIHNKEFLQDREIILEACKTHGMALSSAPDKFKGDEEIAMTAIKNDPFALKLTKDNIRDNEAIVMEAVKNKGWSLLYASDRLKDNKDIVMEALNNNTGALRFASDRLKSDKEVVMKAVKDDVLTLEYADKKLHKDKEIIYEILKNDKNSFEYINPEIKQQYDSADNFIKSYEKENSISTEGKSDNPWEKISSAENENLWEKPKDNSDLER